MSQRCGETLGGRSCLVRIEFHVVCPWGGFNPVVGGGGAEAKLLQVELLLTDVPIHTVPFPLGQ